MEQQDEDWQKISFMGLELPVKFLRGCYCSDKVKGSYSTLEGLKNAWIKKLREEKKAELKKTAYALKTYKGSRRSPYYNRKLLKYRKDKEEWQITGK